MMSTTRKILAPAAGLLAVASLSGCAGSAIMPRADVEKEALAQLSTVVGDPKASVSCPGDLKGDKGTTMDCTITHNDGQQTPVRVLAQGSKGGKVYMLASISGEGRG